jgi:hypothetical protein
MVFAEREYEAISVTHRSVDPDLFTNIAKISSIMLKRRI